MNSAHKTFREYRPVPPLVDFILPVADHIHLTAAVVDHIHLLAVVGHAPLPVAEEVVVHGQEVVAIDKIVK